MNNLFPFISDATLGLVFKGLLLVLLGLYSIFVMIIMTHVRSLNKIILIQKATGSPLIQTISIVYLFITISLFLLAVVIL